MCPSHAVTMLLLHQCLIYTHFVRVSVAGFTPAGAGVERRNEKREQPEIGGDRFATVLTFAQRAAAPRQIKMNNKAGPYEPLVRPDEVEEEAPNESDSSCCIDAGERHRLLLLLMLCNMCLYINRANISVAIVYMYKDGSSESAIVLSSFYWGYLVAQAMCRVSHPSC